MTDNKDKQKPMQGSGASQEPGARKPEAAPAK